MFKKIVAVSAIVLLSACSTMDKRVEKEDSVTAEFMGGEIKITYNKDGQFESISSSGSARMTGTLPSSQEEAFIVAKLRAEQKMVEFMKTELESERFVKVLSDNLQNGQSFNGQPNNEVNAKIASNVKEDIKTRSKGILKGVRISSKKFETSNSIVLVTVQSSMKDIAASKQIATMMGN